MKAYFKAIGTILVLSILTSCSSTKSDPNIAKKPKSLDGTWGSYSWISDHVGEYLIVKKVSNEEYEGAFFSQGQSGGTFEDINVRITDLGQGKAKVYWPSGNSTIATWGKRSSTTPSNMDPNWKGDILFDCIGEVDFAESNADCNFYLHSD